VLVGGGWYGFVVLGGGRCDRARPSMWPVRPYLAPTLSASFSDHYLGTLSETTLAADSAKAA
jgi:hypothetical protein